MKRYILLTFLLILFSPIYGQKEAPTRLDSIAQDTLAFNKYLNETFAEYFPLYMLQRVFAYRIKFEADTTDSGFKYNSEDYGGSLTGKYADYSGNANYSFVHTDTRMVGTDEGIGCGVRTFDNVEFPDTIRRWFTDCFHRYKHFNRRKKVEIHELVQNLQAFQKEAKHFPAFYATISRDYQGNINAYVKDMFKQSIVLQGRRHDRFLRKPSSFKMANDLGVQFVIGIAMYRLWMKEQMEK